MTAPEQPFDGFEPPGPVEKMRARRKRFSEQRIAQGVHPFGRSLADNGRTCGECWHAVLHDPGRRSYWKCEVSLMTHSERTDLRVSWPACVRFASRRPEGFESKTPDWVKRGGGP
jgi:hypothetical protein